MRRRDLSDEELTTVINLKRAGSSWVKIQRETGINRRTAKRAYEKWERSKTTEELKKARKDVAAQAFREHMDSLVALATLLVMNLSVPSLSDLMDKNAKQFFPWLFEQDIFQLGTYISPLDAKEAYAPFVRRRPIDPQSYRRENELLFESLKVHTREKVRWKALDEWKEARDNCKRVLDKLQKETSTVVNNFLKQERETNFLQRVKEGSREDDPAKRMAEVVFKEIWQAILRDKLGEEGPLFQTVTRGVGTAQEISIRGRDETVLYFLYSAASPSLVEKVTHICNLAVNNLCKGKMVQQLHREVRNMEKASQELHEMLNSVKLIPMILGSRCDLCPA